MRTPLAAIGCLLMGLALPHSVAQAQTTRVSVASDGSQAETHSFYPKVSGNGRLVVFESHARNLAPGASGLGDIFLHDRDDRGMLRTSLISSGVHGAAANGRSLDADISADGRWIVFASFASNLVDDDFNGYSDIFLHDTLALVGGTVRISRGLNGEANANSYAPSISADGMKIAFTSRASNLVEVDRNNAFDVFVFDVPTGRIDLVSATSGGSPGDGTSADPSISADGWSVAFVSNAPNLLPKRLDDVDSRYSHVYVRDLRNGLTRQVSVPQPGTDLRILADSDSPSISANGQVIAFASRAGNLEKDPPVQTGRGIYVHELLKRDTTRIDVAGANAPRNHTSGDPSISADGRFVAFMSQATTLVPGTEGRQVYVHDRGVSPGRTTLASVGLDGRPGNSDSLYPSLSADGRVVAFASYATNLVPGDTNGRFSASFVRVLPPPAGCDARADCPEAPGAPATLTAQVAGATVAFTWMAPASGGTVDTFVLSAGGSPGTTFVEVATGTAALSFTVGNVPLGTYFVRVHGRNAAGLGPPSNEVTIDVGGTGGCTVPPGAPSGLSATVAGRDVTLVWTESSGCPATSYVLEAGAATGTADVFTGDVGPVTALNAATTPGTYFVRVRARNIFGLSAPSNEIVVTVGGGCASPPAAPTGLSASVNGQSVSLAWIAAPGCPADSYVLEAGSTSGAADLFTGDIGNLTALTATALPGTYFVRVRGRNAFGTGAPSNEVIVTVP